MLFKFAQDIEIVKGRFLYGDTKRDDNLAQKSVGNTLAFFLQLIFNNALGHELKAMTAILDVIKSQEICSGLRVSLMCRVKIFNCKIL